MSTTRDLEHHAELLLRVLLSVNGGLLGRITDCQQGHPRAASWDLERNSGTPWCWLHHRDLRACHEEGWGCLADDVVATGPSDPTGDAATVADVAAHDRRMFLSAVTRACNAIELMASIAESYPETRKANAYERQQTAEANDPHCESCAQVEIAKGIPWWVEPRTKERSTVGGRLDTPMWLCDWCENHVVQTGIPPSDDEREQHRAGKRILCKHPKVGDAA